MVARIVSRGGAAVGIALIATLTLASCSGGMSSSSAGSSVTTELDPGRMGSGEALTVPEDLSGAQVNGSTDKRLANPEIAPIAPNPGDGSQSLMDEDSAQILTATLALRVKDPQEAAASISSMVSSVNGRVSYSVAKPGNEYEYGSAQLVLRLPPESLQGTIAAISDYGVVLSSESGSQDVSKQKTDYQVRIQSLQTSIQRLNGLLAQSQSTSDLIEIERELQSRESELESMTAVLADLNDQVSYSTLTVSLTAESKDSQPQKVDPENFFTGFQRGLEGLAAFGAGLLVLLGVSLPWLLLLGAIGSVVMVVLTIRRKRRRSTPRHTAPAQTVEPSSTPESQGREEVATAHDGNQERAEEGSNGGDRQL